MSNTKNESSAEAVEAAGRNPSLVGNTFMKQYYHLLSKSPEYLHRFFKDTSLWCHGTGSQIERPISGQKAIHDMIMSRGYAGARVELDRGSIDCQSSLNGSILVLVTGMMTLPSSASPRPFVQTFYLAVQPKGYFVQNDVLRFLDFQTTPSEPVTTAPPSEVVECSSKPATEETKSVANPADGKELVSPPEVSKPAKVPVMSPVKLVNSVKPVEKDTQVVEPVTPISQISGEASSPMATSKKSSETEPKTKEVAIPPTPPKAADETQSNLENESNASTANAEAPSHSNRPASSQPSAPKSWASHLFSSGTPSSKPAVVTPTSKAVLSKPASLSPKPKSSEQPVDSKKLHSLYIRDFPSQTKDQDLRDLFKAYGEIAHVNILSNRGFAFVDFYEAESVKRALAEGAPFELFGKALYVDERGERKENRGSFRNDSRGGRGRANRDRDNGKSRSNNKRTGGDRENNGNGMVSNPSSAPSSAYNSRPDRREKGGRRAVSSAGRANRSE